MKKLLGLLLVATTLTMTLGGCATSAPKELDELSKAEVLEVVEEYCEVDYLTQDILCDTEGVTDVRVLAVINAFEDTTTYPSYMLDESGNYVSVDDLGVYTKSKYFGTTEMYSLDDYYKRGGITLLKYDLGQGDYDQNDLFAKAVLILNEIESYEYYFLSSTDVVIDIVWIDSSYYTHRITLVTSKDNLLSDTLEVTPQGFFTNYLEMEYQLMDTQIDETNITTYYEDYITNGTYDGYVLNYIGE